MPMTERLTTTVSTKGRFILPKAIRQALSWEAGTRPDEDYVTSAEVYQEIMDRFVAIDRRAAIEDTFELLDDLVVSVFPIQRSDVDAAREIVILQRKLSARDCLHLAVMRANGVDRILTFDDGFSAQPCVTRLPRPRAILTIGHRSTRTPLPPVVEAPTLVEGFVDGLIESRSINAIAGCTPAPSPGGGACRPSPSMQINPDFGLQSNRRVVSRGVSVGRSWS